VFGEGVNDEIENYIKRKKAISAVFYSVNMLYGWAQAELEDKFQVPVFDRFSLVLHIFKERAKTKEARLQLALAELPYVRTRIREAAKGGKDTFTVTGNFGTDHTWLEKRIAILKEREKKLKRMIEKLKVQRQVSRTQRLRNKIPTVAVVGYTNCGKSSLIKALTGSKSLIPMDKLFATVDVRLYPGRLDRIHNVYYIDTIGFISDIPTDLIESFKVTLEEVNLADLIIHVQDVSHPDLKNQRQTVYSTLKDMGINDKLLVTMAEVGNKIDKLQHPEQECVQLAKSVDLMISATKETNLNALKHELEKRLLVNMGCFLSRVRILTGGEEYCWLLRNGIILSAEVDDSDQNYTFMDIRFTEAVAGKFRRLFGTSCFIRKRDSQPDQGVNSNNSHIHHQIL
jgi:GTP-binding protein HflX